MLTHPVRPAAMIATSDTAYLDGTQEQISETCHLTMPMGLGFRVSDHAKGFRVEGFWTLSRQGVFGYLGLIRCALD